MGDIIKTVACIRRRADLTVEAFQRYWVENHSGLVKALSGTLSMRRYVQSHLLRGELTDAFGRSRNGLEPCDGIAEVWFGADELGLDMTAAQLEANIALLEDERNFIDLEPSAFLFTTDTELIGPEA